MQNAVELRTILVATDFGAMAAHGLSDASRLALAFGASVELVHVLPAFGRAPPDPEIQKRLDACGRTLTDQGVSVAHCKVVYGSAAETLLRAADESGSDMIVIGAGDRAEHSATGPTVETVARFSQKPVWVARFAGPSSLSRVMCAVDASPASDEALRLAIGISQRFDATLELAHVCEGSLDRDSELRTLSARLAARGADGFPLHVLTGRASDELRVTTLQRDVDLLVMGRIAGGLRRVLLGGTAERLLRRLPAALLLTSPA